MKFNKIKFICDFPPTRYESVGCDDGNFSFPKECDLSPAAYLAFPLRPAT